MQNESRPSINDLISHNAAEFLVNGPNPTVRKEAFEQLFSNFAQWGYTDEDITDRIIEKIAQPWYPSKESKTSVAKKKAWVKHVNKHLATLRSATFRQHYNKEVVIDVPLPVSNPVPVSTEPEEESSFDPEKFGEEHSKKISKNDTSDFKRVSKDLDDSIFKNIDSPKFEVDEDFCDALGIPKEHRDE